MTGCCILESEACGNAYRRGLFYLDCVADELCLLGLRADEHIVVAESLYSLHFWNAQHSHSDIYDSVEGTEFLHALHLRTVVRRDGPRRHSLLHGHEVGWPLVHSCDEREARFLHRSTYGAVLRVEQVVGVYDALLGVRQQGAGRFVHPRDLPAAGIVVGDERPHNR